MPTSAQIVKAKELARELYIHSTRMQLTCWEDALRFTIALDELAELALTAENPSDERGPVQDRPASTTGAGRFLVEREGPDVPEYYAHNVPGCWTRNWRKGDLHNKVSMTLLPIDYRSVRFRPLSEVEAENAGCRL